MRTLGVDLASQAAKTASAVIVWDEERAQLAELDLECDDARILELGETADAIGIDAPFGWPTPFIELTSGAAPPEPWSDDQVQRLRFRATDFAAWKALGRPPLSVSTDRISYAAMRCQWLLVQLQVSDRAGDGRTFEVYPALALHRWGLPSKGYKGSQPDRQAARRDLWLDLAARTPWLNVPAPYRELVLESDDALDAVVASLVARAAALGLVDPIPPEFAGAATREGWIATPTGSARLSGSARRAT